MHKTTNCDARLLLPTSSLTPPMTLVSFQFDEARRGTPQCPLIQTLGFLYCKQNQQKQQVQNGRTKYHSQSSYDQNGSIKGNPCDIKEKNMALTPKTIYNKQKIPRKGEIQILQLKVSLTHLGKHQQYFRSRERKGKADSNLPSS